MSDEIVQDQNNLIGRWNLKQYGLGPSQGSMEWWDANRVSKPERQALFDDEIVFNNNGKFNNVMGDTTWLES